jgi:hypothetical protein
MNHRGQMHRVEESEAISLVRTCFLNMSQGTDSALVVRTGHAFLAHGRVPKVDEMLVGCQGAERTGLAGLGM